MVDLKERAGKLDGILKDFFEQASESGNAVTGKGLVEYLKNHLPAEVQKQIKTDFEEVNPLD